MNQVSATPISFIPPLRPGRPVVLEATPQPAAIDLARTALIVVDMQNDFLAAEGWFPSAGLDTAPLLAILPQLRHLTDRLRQVGLPVVWLNWGVRADRANLPRSVLHTGGLGGARPTYADPSPSGRGRILVQGEWGAGLITELEPDNSDLVVHKHRLSGFWDNELDSILRRRGVDTLLFAGINIDRCVFATLMDASFLGYGCVLLQDVCATPSPDYVREAVLYLVRLLYGVTATAADLLAAIAAEDPEPSNAGAQP